MWTIPIPHMNTVPYQSHDDSKETLRVIEALTLVSQQTEIVGMPC